MNIVLIGVQGSGKGTQAKLLVEKTGWKHVTTGDLLRDNIANGTELGMKAKSFMDKGELVPDSYVFEIVRVALKSLKDGFILDGFPRNKKQLDFLRENFKIDYAVLLDLADEKAIERLTARRHCEDCKKDYNLLYSKPEVDGVCDDCGGKIVARVDDNEATINKRIEKFHLETNPVIESFAADDLLIKVNADQSVMAIHEEILTKLKNS
ncbi:MAG: nucleoside monophosphate kinase [Candidatus Cloacimonetes bacterium]|nr:nucleoside monophosphate kinase [Candidatus Cloacimonadota bacterium]MCF7813535.1 nucleoside monophosphate kinase [Candidatus Cloacimonadota bacterium]MCF7884189.1 nucleoside monophosphate kinase [Candidatus Cloacimonadota bacterium]